MILMTCVDEDSSLLFGHTPSAGEQLPTFRKNSLSGEAAEHPRRPEFSLIMKPLWNETATSYSIY